MKIALIGYGYWGPNIARHLQSNGRLSFAAICDPRKDRLDKARSLYLDRLDYVEDYHRLLDDEELDVVAIAVETTAHYGIARDALRAGKSVFIEKPLTSTVTEAEGLKELADERGLVVHVDHIMVFHPCIRKIKDIVDAGDLGEILYFDAQRANLGQIRKDVSAMWDLAVHDLSVLDCISAGACPVSVNAVGAKHYGPRESLTFVTLKYEKFLAHVMSNWISPLKERKIIVAGSKKMAVFDDMKVSEKLMIYDKGFDILADGGLEYADYVVRARTGDAWSPYVPEKDALFESIEHFVDCVKEKKPSISGPDAAIRVLRILERAEESMNGKRIAK